MNPKQRRLDLWLTEAKLVSTRSKAQELIRAGQVRVNGKTCKKPGEQLAEDARVELLGQEHPYVSRGGLKLAAALENFPVPVLGVRALDIGQSTGGFTHCLLLRGARQVVGVEVGHGQLAPSLREDPRVVCYEKTDIRELRPELVAPGFQLCVADLSFISLTHVIPGIGAFLVPGAHLVLLVKPQFELGPGDIASGGLVKDETLRIRALEKVEEVCSRHGFTVAGKMPSPIAGGDGNQEFLLHLRWASSNSGF